MTETADLAIIRSILTAGRTAIVTTRAASGALHSRPLALVSDDDVEFEGTLWFFTEDPSGKTDDVRRHPEVNVSVSDGKGYLSLSGSAEVNRDQARIDHLWNPFVEAWFEAGPDDPKIALLRVDVETIEYWDTDKPTAVKLFETVKALITKTQPDVGESHTVAL